MGLKDVARNHCRSHVHSWALASLAICGNWMGCNSGLPHFRGHDCFDCFRRFGFSRIRFVGSHQCTSRSAFSCLVHSILGVVLGKI